MDAQRMKSHVVVGGGTSSLILCNQLLQAGHKVILLDKGGSSSISSSYRDERTWFQRMLGLISSNHLWTFQSHEEKTTTQIFTSSQKALNQRHIEYCLGIGLGGTSNINAMMFDLGNDEVFNRYWPSSWNAEVMRRYASEVEAIVHSSDVYTSGNIETLLASQQSRTNYKATIDSSTGLRWKLERVLQKQWLESGQLTVLQDHEALRVVIDQDKAIAVEVVDPLGQQKLIYPEHYGEIILCAGVFGSPDILRRSLGRDLLKTPLYDHIILPYIMVGNWFSGWKTKTQQNWMNKYPINSVHGWIMLDADGKVLDVNRDNKVIPTCQLVFLDGRISPGLTELLLPRYSGASLYSRYLRPLLMAVLKYLASTSIFHWICGHVFGVLVCLVQPKSVGNVQLTKSTISIDPQFLQCQEDQDALYRAFLSARNIIADGSKTTNLVSIEALPGPLFDFAKNKTNFLNFASNFATTYFHPCGTCRMSTSTSADDGIVDDELRVKGVQGLRVADASVIPHIPNVPIAKTVMTIGAIAAAKLTGSFSKTK